MNSVCEIGYLPTWIKGYAFMTYGYETRPARARDLEQIYGKCNISENI